jgi:hypothetical protein
MPPAGIKELNSEEGDTFLLHLPVELGEELREIRFSASMEGKFNSLFLLTDIWKEH